MSRHTLELLKDATAIGLCLSAIAWILTHLSK